MSFKNFDYDLAWVPRVDMAKLRKFDRIVLARENALLLLLRHLQCCRARRELRIQKSPSRDRCELLQTSSLTPALPSDPGFLTGL